MPNFRLSVASIVMVLFEIKAGSEYFVASYLLPVVQLTDNW